MGKSRVVNATEFKAKCLALLDEVEQGESITVTRRGKPVAVVSPVKRKALKNPANSWADRGTIVGDIVSSDPEIWDIVNGREPL
jgi:prevent-host-death family protein